ncbi:hypothetical protein JOC24_002609 [Streptomyces sp. HB132]|nr:hypothetical protein [Streptomyces sp. HB132]
MTSTRPPAAAGSPSSHRPHRPAVSAAGQFVNLGDSPIGQVSGPIRRMAPAPSVPPAAAGEALEAMASCEAAASIQVL